MKIAQHLAVLGTAVALATPAWAGTDTKLMDPFLPLLMAHGPQEGAFAPEEWPDTSSDLTITITITIKR